MIMIYEIKKIIKQFKEGLMMNNFRLKDKQWLDMASLQLMQSIQLYLSCININDINTSYH